MSQHPGLSVAANRTGSFVTQLGILGDGGGVASAVRSN